MQFAARTHPGQREGENEDSVGSDGTNQLWLVADGMGGHASGRVASQIVCDKLLELASISPLDAAVLEAHAAVRSAAERDQRFQGMGSTVVAAQVTDQICRIVWVGDSRAYLWRSGTLSRLTRDHSLRELLRTLPDSLENAPMESPQRHLISQVLGLGDPLPSHVDLQLRSGDRILLASDGLNGELEDHELAAILATSADASSAADALISAALTKGGRDNVSTVVVDFETLDELQDARALESTWKANVWPAVLGGILLAVLAAALWWHFSMRR